MTNLGSWRYAIASTGTLGVLALAIAHTAETQPEIAPWTEHMQRFGTALLLGTWPAALAVTWRSSSHSPTRWIAAILAVPWIVRIAAAGPNALLGEAVAGPRANWLGSTIVISAIALGIFYRPRVRGGIRITLAIVVALFCLWLRGQYDDRFGHLESSLSGLLESFFGFAIPYPAYVADWRVSLMTVAVFFILTTVASALVSLQDRKTGVALMLLTLGGLGLGSPHLALLVGTGALMLVDSGLPGPTPRVASTDQPIAPVAAELAQQLGLEPPIVLEHESVVAVEGSVENCSVRWRARAKGDLWEIQLSVGSFHVAARRYICCQTHRERLHTTR
ncbi:MAG: hypothetical protein B7733_13660 [Myxococcales bacterium FL481]|nr:MAG: hypothetical protein B7733_13660 [Myxococcales bacterium FL481]